jgi:hypothetical protein
MDVLADKNVRDRLEDLRLWAHYPGGHASRCEMADRAIHQGCIADGATPQELMESLWVATEIRAGGAYPWP